MYEIHEMKIHEMSLETSVIAVNLLMNWATHEFRMTSSPQQQGVGDKIDLKTDDGQESIFSPGTDSTQKLTPCKNKY